MRNTHDYNHTVRTWIFGYSRHPPLEKLEDPHLVAKLYFVNYLAGSVGGWWLHGASIGGVL